MPWSWMTESSLLEFIWAELFYFEMDRQTLISIHLTHPADDWIKDYERTYLSC